MSSAPRSLPMAPGPRGIPLIGSTFEARRDPLGLFCGALARYGNLVQFRFGPFLYVLVNEPEAIKYVLVDNRKNYTKSRNYNGLRHVLGDGLITTDGEHWERQRKIAQPAFHRDRLLAFCDTMGEVVREMLDRWETSDAWSAGAGASATSWTATSEINIHEEMMRLTFDVVGRTLFSTRLDARAEGIGRAITVALVFAADYAEALVPLPPWVPTPGNVRFRKALRTLDQFVFSIVSERRARTERPNDLLSMLMDAQDENTREKMTDRQLRDELMTVVLAGLETTANALTWAFYLLSRHIDIARRLVAEVDGVLDGARTTPSLADLAQLGLTKRVVEESMRLYPPVWGFERQAINEDVVHGFRIPKGTIVGISPYTLHRHPSYWDDPQRFNPDRFLPEAMATRPRYVYLPFGGGPRMCIGSAFAMMEAQIVLASVVRRWRLDLAPGARVEASPVITLRPRYGMPMTRLRRRDGPPAAFARGERPNGERPSPNGSAARREVRDSDAYPEPPSCPGRA